VEGARRRVRIFGRELFVVREGEGSAPPLLVLHGFPTSSFDMRAALPSLAADRPVIVHDHLGFGFSDKPARKPAEHVGREAFSYSLLEQAEMAIGLWRELGVTRAICSGTTMEPAWSPSSWPDASAGSCRSRS